MSDVLPPLPEPYMRTTYRSIPPRPPVALFTEDQIRAYGEQCAAAQRERDALAVQAVMSQEGYDDYTVYDEWPDPATVIDRCVEAIRSQPA